MYRLVTEKKKLMRQEGTIYHNRRRLNRHACMQGIDKLISINSAMCMSPKINRLTKDKQSGLMFQIWQTRQT